MQRHTQRLGAFCDIAFILCCVLQHLPRLYVAVRGNHMLQIAANRLSVAKCSAPSRSHVAICGFTSSDVANRSALCITFCSFRQRLLRYTTRVKHCKNVAECCRQKKGVEKWEKKLYNKSAGTVEVVTHRRRADSEVQLQIGHLAFLARAFCC